MSGSEEGTRQDAHLYGEIGSFLQHGVDFLGVHPENAISDDFDGSFDHAPERMVVPSSTASTHLGIQHLSESVHLVLRDQAPSTGRDSHISKVGDLDPVTR